MPVNEIPVWRAYIQKNGPLSAQRRIEYASAQVASILASQNRDPKKPALSIKDFLLWSREELLPDAPEDIRQAFGEIAKIAGPTRDGRAGKKMWKRRKAA